MLNIITTNQFEKDVKLSHKRGKKLNKLKDVIDRLAAGQPLPFRHKPHKLSGNWDPYWECHIEPDWLLIYLVEKDSITFVRTGSHADLFG